jgi:hypothetical protein
MLTGGEITLFKGALGCKTTLALKEKLLAFAPAKFTNWT